MSRKKKIYRSFIKKDKKFESILIQKMINKLIIDGKKIKAEKIFYDSLDIMAKKVEKPPLEAFNKVIDNVKPTMEVKSRRVGGSNYQVPVEVSESRAITLAIRWIVQKVRSKKGKSTVEKLTEELLDAYNKTGASMKKKEDTHKMADANKAFAHFRW